MLSRPQLVIFARIPRIGSGKTRLARDIGVIGAWHFARNTLATLMRRLRSPRWLCWLACTPDYPQGRYRLPPGWRTLRQGRGDLGRRLARTMRALPPGPVVIIGSDAPEIIQSHIVAAFSALGAADVVIGPANDGGFWLIGATGRSRARIDFRDIRWSTGNTLRDTLGGLAGRPIRLLQTLDDVDDGAGYRAWRRRQGSGAPDHDAVSTAVA